MKTGRPVTMDRKGEPENLAALKESVAAHQAVCSCHPVEMGSHESCEDKPFAYDSQGNPWAIDPLCKIRPEARR